MNPLHPIALKVSLGVVSGKPLGRGVIRIGVRLYAIGGLFMFCFFVVGTDRCCVILATMLVKRSS